jgi:hypothetical protein
VSDEPRWDVTFEASRGAQIRDWARLTVEQSLEWLEEAIEIAATSGALARERKRRDDEFLKSWNAA